MGEFDVAPCEHIFSFECSGEVVNLIHAAERYGILIEKARTRIDTICRRCRKFSAVAGNAAIIGAHAASRLEAPAYGSVSKAA